MCEEFRLMLPAYRNRLFFRAQVFPSAQAALEPTSKGRRNRASKVLCSMQIELDQGRKGRKKKILTSGASPSVLYSFS